MKTNDLTRTKLVYCKTNCVSLREKVSYQDCPSATKYNSGSSCGPKTLLHPEDELGLT